jgi:uncharacterized membrane protein
MGEVLLHIIAYPIVIILSGAYCGNNWYGPLVIDGRALRGWCDSKMARVINKDRERETNERKRNIY